MSARLHHHPADESLLAYAAGTLDQATSVLIATHLSLCPHCRGAVHTAESVGGEFLERIEPGCEMAASAADVLAMIERRANENDIVVRAHDDEIPALKDLGQIPRPLRSYIADAGGRLKWRWMGPGVRYAHVAGDSDTGKVGLLRIAPGTKLPRHGHTEEELTMVLSGSYESAKHRYARGDVEWADGAVIHQPSAGNERECVCLVVTRGTLRATGLLAPLIQPLMAI